MLYITCIYLTYDWYMVHRTVWLLFPPMLSTSAIVVLISTLHQPYLTQTNCGLYVCSSSLKKISASNTFNQK
jgi:hypothetical protein